MILMILHRVGSFINFAAVIPSTLLTDGKFRITEKKKNSMELPGFRCSKTEKGQKWSCNTY